MPRTSSFKPALAAFATISSGWVFVLVALGAFTTTIGAGMAFPDWPLSNGSVNPHGWLTDIDKFAEHSHRLSGAVMGCITIILAVWLHRCEERRWLRRLGWWALGIVIVQGLIGGKRVLLNSLNVPGFDMSFGQMLRLPHGLLAQVYVCMLFAIVVGLSRGWVENTLGTPSERVRRLGWWCVLLLFVQLGVAVSMRHNYAGLAIPTFPSSTPEGGLLPAIWDYKVALHFAHRAMAAVIGVMILIYGHFLWREKSLIPPLRAASLLLVGLVAGQIYLGAQIIWTGRSVAMTTGHVILGALTLAVTFGVASSTQRGSIERARP
jgi:cytochrome c oxidase assembly protein subunit 15